MLLPCLLQLTAATLAAEIGIRRAISSSIQSVLTGDRSNDNAKDKRSTYGIARAITVIDASIEDCAAWDFARMTRERAQENRERGGLERKLVTVNDHSAIYYLARDFKVRTREEQSNELIGHVYDISMSICIHQL